MTTDCELPITIKVSAELKDVLSSIDGVCNKLEAQLNFQTLAAGWYGDEENILLINIFLLSPEDFTFQKTQTPSGQLMAFADDVFSYHDEAKKQLDCFIAITESELALLTQQEKILASYLEKKALKVINLIAEQLCFTTI